MNYLCKLGLSVMLATTPFAASADSWKDESGHGKGRGHSREFKEEYLDGNCKVERKLEKSGEYKEERKCKPPREVYYQQQPVYPAVVVDPGITVHGTVRIGQ